MITLKTLRTFIAALPDNTKFGIDDDRKNLVFRDTDSMGLESLLHVGRLDACGAYEGEVGYEGAPVD